MNSKIEYALIWKELRQSGPIVAAFSLMSLIIVAHLSWLHNYSPHRMTHYTLPSISEWLHYYTFFISLGLAYLMAAGNRVIEANDNLEAFLFIRPVERSTLVRIYYFVGLVGIVVWFVLFFMFVYLFFGSEIFTVTLSRQFDDWSTTVGLLYSMVALFSAHAIAFGVSLISPSLISTSCFYIASYVAALATIIDASQEPNLGSPKLFVQVFQGFFVPVLMVFVLAGSIAATILYYQKKEVR